MFFRVVQSRNRLTIRTSHVLVREYASGSIVPTQAAPNRVRRLPDHPVRTRFAPSPTGYLHLGSLRTALFNYLLAKATGGQFILRIEDTDQKRTISDSEERLCADLKWAGLAWDEGPEIGGPYGPYHQSKRTSVYREHAEKLLCSGAAYRCFCSSEKLQSLAKLRAESGLPTAYDRTCAHIPASEAQDRAAQGEAHIIRLRVPESYPTFWDAVHGKIRSQKQKNRKRFLHPPDEDIVLLKSDGFPTYHLANVVDDHLMKISHVIRGSEWLPSTPKHLVMYEAFGWTAPTFAHVGLLVDKSGQKLSKRNLGQDISVFRDEMDLLPETLTNYVALLGWSHSRRNDVMSLEELVGNFSMNFTTGNTVASFEKLWYLQRAHAERTAIAAQNSSSSNIQMILTSLKVALKDMNIYDQLERTLLNRNLDDYLKLLFYADARNYTSASAFLERNKYFLGPPTAQVLEDTKQSFIESLHHHRIPLSITKRVVTDDIITIAEDLSMLNESSWTVDSIQSVIKSVVSSKATETLKNPGNQDLQEDFDMTIKMLKTSWSHGIHRYIRWAISAGQDGPDSARAMAILGRSESLKRFQTANAILDVPNGSMTIGSRTVGCIPVT